jgi:hypothetical protein
VPGGSRVLLREWINNMISEEAVNVFIEQVVHSLGFLTKDHHFDFPTAEIDRQIGKVTVTFRKGELAIEANYELREEDIDVKVVKLIQGRKPKGYHVDPQGRRFREHLYEVFLDRGARSFGLRPSAAERKKWNKNTDDGRRARMKWVLDRYGSLLNEYGQDILAGSLDVFNELEVKKRP